MFYLVWCQSLLCVFFFFFFFFCFDKLLLLRSRRLKVVGTRKKGRARRRHACPPRAHPFFLSPATQANKLNFVIQLL